MDSAGLYPQPCTYAATYWSTTPAVKGVISRKRYRTRIVDIILHYQRDACAVKRYRHPYARNHRATERFSRHTIRRILMNHFKAEAVSRFKEKIFKLVLLLSSPGTTPDSGTIRLRSADLDTIEVRSG